MRITLARRIATAALTLAATAALTLGASSHAFAGKSTDWGIEKPNTSRSTDWG